jgi:hypothetical protein
MVRRLFAAVAPEARVHPVPGAAAPAGEDSVDFARK